MSPIVPQGRVPGTITGGINPIFHIGYSTLHKPLSGYRSSVLLGLGLLIFSPAQVFAGAGVCPLPDTASIDVPATNDGRTRMTSDVAEVEEDGSSRLSGNVRLERGDHSLEAEELYFNAATGEAEVRGEAKFRTPNLRVESSNARIKVDTQEGEFENTRFALTDSGARGHADRLTSEAGVITLEDSDYTTCPQDDEFWQVRAQKIALNRNTGWGEAWKSKIRVLDTTVFYLPYVWFPIDERRQSGFLPPSIGNNSDTGFEFSIPYYLNLAPNYDATLVPRFMSDRGHQLSGEFRYMRQNSLTSVGGEFLYKDDQTNEQRDLIFLEHQGLITRNTALSINYTRVSDQEYFTDLDNTITRSARNFLDQRFLLSWNPGPWFSADILTSQFQTLNTDLTTAQRPYQRMPRIRAKVSSPNVHGLLFDLGTEATRFEHTDQQLVNGWRYHVEPALSLVLDNGGAYWKNRVALRYTSYSLDNTAPGQDDAPDRAIPSFSSDLGLRFERLMSNGGLHLLEPRLFYLYVAEDDQDDLPIFDTGDPSFRFSRLFAENRYIGNDRIGDAHHVALAVTNRWLDPNSGRLRTELNLGQIIRIEEPEVFLPNVPTPDPDHSEFIAEVTHHFTEEWSSRLMTQWDSDDGEVNRASTGLRYYDDRQRLFDIAYRFRRDFLEQADLSFSWPLAASWNVVGRFNYSIDPSENIESLLGLEYTDCCWGIRGAVRQYVTEPNGKQSTGVYLELNLLGLGGFGKSYDRLLERDTLRSVYE